jgi:hypothetical protein
MRSPLISSAAFIVLLIALWTMGVPALAHHSIWVEFDREFVTEIRGRFVEIDWINPHSWVHLEVTQPDGTSVRWAVQTPPPNQLIRLGWRRSDLTAGDEIVVRGYGARSGANRLWAQNVAIVAQNGRELPAPRTVMALLDPNPDGVPAGVLPGRN